MKKLYFLPYHLGITSVRELQNILGGWQIRPQNSQYVYSPDHFIVVWGHGHTPPWGESLTPRKNILNHWGTLPNTINKLRAFKLFKAAGVPTPGWTTSRKEAEQWAEAGSVVFCRTKLTSMEGRGIVLAKRGADVVDAQLYTKLFPKDKEYRVHVFNGEVIDYTQKKLKKDAHLIQGRDEYVRNTANGWIFARQDVAITESIRDVATQAIKALGLDFGAVDLAVNKAGKVVVFEVNTAPGTEGTTTTKYAEAIKSYWKTLK